MNKPPTRYLIITSIVCGVLAFVSIMPALFAPMMFDAPGSRENPATQLLFWSTFTFPIVCLAGIALGWIAYKLKAFGFARVAILLLPVLGILAGIAALVWLEVAYDGQFNGQI